jgi:integrase
MQVGKTKSGVSYFYRVIYKDPNNGEEKRKYQAGFAGKKEAGRACKDFVESLQKTVIEKPKVTFKDLVDDYQSSRKIRVKPTSYTGTQRMLKMYMLPTFGKRNIVEITKLDVRKWADELQSSSLSPKYKNDLLTLAKSVFSHGVEYFDLNVNPVNNIQRLKNDKQPLTADSIWTVDEFHNFIVGFNTDDLEEKHWKIFFTLLYWTGIRRGEIKALQFADFKIDTCEIDINKSCTNKVTGMGLVMQTPKTKGSKRKIPLDQLTYNMMLEYYNYRKEQPGFSMKHFIFNRPNNPLMPFADTTIQNRKNRMVEKIGMKVIKIHGFRHSHASVLIGNNMDPAAVAERLGHSSAVMTLNVYTHVLPESVKKTVSLIDHLRKED